MDDLKDHFLQRSIAGLQEVSIRLRDGDAGVLRDTFRTLHTIKGTAQTFGFAEAAGIAHRLEDLLAGAKDELFTDFNTLRDGIALLIKSLEQPGPVDTKGLTERVGKIEPDNENKGLVFISRIPFEVLDKFSNHERNRLFSANEAGQGIYRIDVAFDLAGFTSAFKNFRVGLDLQGETIATLPGENTGGTIGFRLYFAGKENNDLIALCQDHSARFDRVNLGEHSENGLASALSLIGEHGRTLAADLCKKVEIVISIGDIATKSDTSKLIFDILLHLVRNAVDHAFDKSGTIRIGLKSEDAGLVITVADNGRGIDREKLKSLAAQKNLRIDADLADLIFQTGVSTADEVSEISGRGIGLDAVKTMVENAGGSISVKSETGTGTTFEILLSVPPAVAGG